MSALRPGDKVLITGGTGWIGSHVADEALAAGLKIKLAIRNQEKAKTITDALEKVHGSSQNIETIIVQDYNEEGAYNEAIKGVQGVVHVASDMTFSSNADEVIPPVLKAYKNILEAAASSNSHESIRRFVLTSSSTAAGLPNVEKGRTQTQHFDANTWNEKALKEYKENPTGMNVYAASKTLSEKFAWDFIKDRKPSFSLTTILPNTNFGAPVLGVAPLTTGAWITDLATTGEAIVLNTGPQFHVDVGDVAKLHIIALINDDVKNERILAFGERYTINSLIDAIKKAKPEAPTPEHKEEWAIEDNTTVDVQRANELLKDQGGLRNLEYSVKAALHSL